MNSSKHNLKIAIIITAIIFLQKFYRHPEDFAYMFNEGVSTYLLSIIGLIVMFGGVLTFVFLGLAALQTIIEKIKNTKFYINYKFYIIAFIFLSIVSYLLTP